MRFAKPWFILTVSVLSVLLFIWYSGNWKDRHYLKGDIAGIDKVTWWIAWGIVVTAMVWEVVDSFRHPGEGRGARVPVNILTLAAGSIVLHALLLFAGLYLNLLSPGRNHYRVYLVITSNASPSSTFLYDLNAREIKGELAEHGYLSGHHPGDTVRIEFQEGLLGIDYLK